jgi:F0F1-type ATP synthase membrane subunit b/b'
MKKSVTILGMSVILIGLAWASCKTPAEKVENAQNNVNEAQADLNQANSDYQADMEKFRKATADSIEANNKSIIAFKARIEKEKKETREEYRKKIAALETENTDMKKRMDDFKADSKEKWEAFKLSFSKDMHELGDKFRKLTGSENK